MQKASNLEDLLNRFYYIVECDNFIFYPKTIRPMGFEISPDELNIITDEVDILTKENKRYPIEYLENFKSFEEAKTEAERLNNIPENKRRSKEWNSPEAIYKRNLLMQELKGE